jgi:hypothetical protein
MTDQNARQFEPRLRPQQPPPPPGLDKKRDRLVLKVPRFIEGEAEGRYAISALVILVLVALAALVALKAFIP